MSTVHTPVLFCLLSIKLCYTPCRFPLPPKFTDIADDSLDIVFESSSETNNKSVLTNVVKPQQTSSHPLSNIVETSESTNTDNSNSINTSLQFGSSGDSDSSSSSLEKAALCPMNPKETKRRNSTSVVS